MHQGPGWTSSGMHKWVVLIYILGVFIITARPVILNRYTNWFISIGKCFPIIAYDTPIFANIGVSCTIGKPLSFTFHCSGVRKWSLCTCLWACLSEVFRKMLECARKGKIWKLTKCNNLCCFKGQTGFTSQRVVSPFVSGREDIYSI